LNPDGSLDPTLKNTGASGPIYSVALQPDGSFLIGGLFNVVCGARLRGIVRLNSLGGLDTSFYPGRGDAPGTDGAVEAIMLQNDGKVLVGGAFTKFGAEDWNHIVRLTPHGIVNESFKIGSGADDSINSSAIQSDGRIVIGGRFTTINGIPRNSVARLNADGTPDITFDPGIGANGPVNAVALDQDKKILIAGTFSSFNGANRPSIVRLNSDGSLDDSFNSGEGADGPVYSLALQGDGNIFVAGDFLTIKGQPRGYVARLFGGSEPDSPTLNIQKQSDEVVLIWADAGFSLQSSSAVEGR
jgi:uncharacterized delta-60 repeat protein